MRQFPEVVPRAGDALFDEQFVDPFVEQAIYVFDRLFAWRLERDPPYPKIAAAPTFDISGVMRLGGRVRGAVVLSLSRATACRATSLLLERPCRYLNDDVADTVRELTNTVTGRAAGLLSREHVRFSLPIAVIGHTRPLDWPPGIVPMVFELHSSADTLALEIGLQADPLAESMSRGRQPSGAILF
jgi:CheY-specific phosphatase CheX